MIIRWYVPLADVLIETGQTSEAIPTLEKTSAQKPALGCARYELGRAWFRQGAYEKAEGHLQAATALNPFYAPAYVLLGQCYAKLGKADKAQAAFQKSRALDEEHLEHMQQNLAPAEPPTEQLNLNKHMVESKHPSPARDKEMTTKTTRIVNTRRLLKQVCRASSS